MKKTKRFTALCLAALMALTLVGCKDSGDDDNSYTKISEEDDTVYTICIAQQEDSGYYSQITAGFTDALTDLFGENHLNVTTQVAGEDFTIDQVVADCVQTSGTQLIFANGKKAVAAADAATETIPVVGAGVIDYETLLNIQVEQPEAEEDPGQETPSEDETPEEIEEVKWDKYTGSNITGVSSVAPMVQQLSLLIEATPDLQTVGLLYNPLDSDSIYQNELMEEYLNQAGIPWKEYAVPLLIEENEDADDAKSADEKDTADNEVTDANDAAVGDATEVETEEPREPQISQYWTGPKVELAVLEDEDADASETSAQEPEPSQAINTLDEENISEELDPSTFITDLPEDATTEDVIEYACKECSVLYIPAQSMLTNQMDEIGSLATEAGVSTVGGDSVIGANTLVTLYLDSYNMGYQAGKMAYKILVKEQNPGEIKILGPAENSTAKLYNKDIAEALGITFPKSFTELNDFIADFTLGSYTTRIESED